MMIVRSEESKTKARGAATPGVSRVLVVTPVTPDMERFTETSPHANQQTTQ